MQFVVDPAPVLNVLRLKGGELAFGVGGKGCGPDRGFEAKR
jgi:hypothetical protein